jgi:hypothetical protein
LKILLVFKGAVYELRNEERLNTGPMPLLPARAKYREWSCERIANICAV